MPGTKLRGRLRSTERPRRSHAERTAHTRGRAMAAVVQSMAEKGFQRTTAAEIARRAGITWGAVQHHFGGKDGILLAVLDDALARLAEQLARVPERDTLDDRIGAFVDQSWAHFSSAHFRTTLEILLNLPAGPEIAWQSEMHTAWARIWGRCFPEGRMARKRNSALLSYTISVLTGLAVTQVLAGGRPVAIGAELEFLKDTLRTGLGAGGARRGRARIS